MKGSIITFNGGEKEYRAYVSPSTTGSPGPAVVVIQEWWGLVDHIKDVCDRFAEEGFTALAPDLYFGEETTEPTRAGELMMALSIADTDLILSKAVDEVLSHPESSSAKAGIVGFCMGGQLAVYQACHNPRIGACVNFYGIHPKVEPSYRQLEAPLLGIFAELDEYSSPGVIKALEEELTLLGRQHTFHVYPGCHHAFFNDTRSSVYDAEAAKDAWQKTTAFLRENLA